MPVSFETRKVGAFTYDSPHGEKTTFYVPLLGHKSNWPSDWLCKVK